MAGEEKQYVPCSMLKYVSSLMQSNPLEFLRCLLYSALSSSLLILCSVFSVLNKLVEDIQQIGVVGSQFMESLVVSSSNATTRGWTL